LLKIAEWCSSLWEAISELRIITCHMGSHSVSCHLTWVHATCHNPSQTGQYSIYLPQRNERLSWPSCVCVYRWYLCVEQQRLCMESAERSELPGNWAPASSAGNTGLDPTPLAQRQSDDSTRPCSRQRVQNYHI